MSITWGNQSFDGPYTVGTWNPPFRAGLYAIMMKPEPQTKPDTFRILYFGESGNLSERGFFRQHHKYVCWIGQAGSESNLYIGIHLMPNSTLIERQQIETALIKQYRPKCND